MRFTRLPSCASRWPAADRFRREKVVDERQWQTCGYATSLHAAQSALNSALCLLLAHAGVACRRSGSLPTPVMHSPAPWFQDVSATAQLEFVHDAGSLPKERYFMPQIMGSGAALFDYDNDGRLDIYLLQNAGPDSRATNRLFHQEADRTFTDRSAGSGLDIAGYGMGVAVGDANNDGWLDLFVTEYLRTRLFLNRGHGTFADLTAEAGLNDPLWASAACFFDYDCDGWLDLVVVNYLQYDATKECPDLSGKLDYCGPSSFAGTVTMLFRNRGGDPATGQGLRFEDVTAKSGLAQRAGPGLGVVCVDFNGDRWPDILVADDGQPNRLWINHGDGTFTEEALLRGIAVNALGRAEANMGIACGDLRGKGLFDIFVTHLTGETHTLWVQEPKGFFEDRTATSGLTASAWRGTGFGTVLADFDNDGELDLAVVNGRVRHESLLPARIEAAQALGPFWSQYAERNQLFINEGGGHFRDVSEQNAAFCGAPGVFRALACGDFDNDGVCDLLVTAVGGAARLYHNVAENRGNWLLVRAFDPGWRRDAYGARITVKAGERRFVRWINPSYSYFSSNDPRAHFGLGAATAISGIDVVWPDGVEESFPPAAANQLLIVRKGEGNAACK